MHALTTACFACARERELERLPVRERIAVDEYWRVAHAFGTAMEGWLVLVPRRHVLAIAELTDAEAGHLGVWQVRLSRALKEVTGCAKTYVAQFAEADGFAHVHFHLVPRPVDLPERGRGPRVFEYLSRPEHERVPTERMDALAHAIQQALACLPTSLGATLAP